MFPNLSECLTDEEVLEKAKLNYIVEKKDIEVPFTDEGGNVERAIQPRHVSIVRTDKIGIDAILGCVGRQFGLIQHADMVDFCRGFTTDGYAEFYAGGPLNKGEQVFLLMKQPDWVDLGAGDKVSAYFCITSAHDGSKCFRAMPLYLRELNQTVITPTCSDSAFKIKHTVNAIDRMRTLAVVRDRLKEYWQNYAATFRSFATIKLSDQTANEYFELVFPDSEKTTTRAENARTKVFDIYKTTGVGCNLPSCKETLLGALFAVVYYADYYQIVKASKHKNEMAARIHSRIEGSSAELKAKSIRMAEKIKRFTD
jgi:phage/plasmid-like protein (TIGR03299 family)